MLFLAIDVGHQFDLARDDREGAGRRISLAEDDVLVAELLLLGAQEPMPAAKTCRQNLLWTFRSPIPRVRRWTYARLSIKQKEGLPLFKANSLRQRGRNRLKNGGSSTEEGFGEPRRFQRLWTVHEDRVRGSFIERTEDVLWRAHCGVDGYVVGRHAVCEGGQRFDRV